MSLENDVSRRTVMKKAGMAGIVPASAATFQTSETERLPELRNHQEVVKWMEVPKEWVAHKEAALKVRKQVDERFGDAKGLVEIGVTGAPERYGGERGFEIKIGIDREKFKREVPDHVDGIPVKTTEKSSPEPVCHHWSYNDLTGGVKASDTSGLDKWGTTGWLVSYLTDSGSWVNGVLTANHIVDVSDDVYGDETGGSFQKIGTVVRRSTKGDVAVIDTDRNIINDIRGENSTYFIGGWVTEDGVASRVKDRFDGYRKMGDTTGETTGGLIDCHLDDSYSSDMPSFWGHGVRGGADTAVGDSGGPAFSLHDGDAYIIFNVGFGDGGQQATNANCVNHDPYKESVGAAAYRINDEWPIAGVSHS